MLFSITNDRLYTSMMDSVRSFSYEVVFCFFHCLLLVLGGLCTLNPYPRPTVRWTKSQLLEEMGLTDASQPRDTLLCWLSQQPGLEYFRCALFLCVCIVRIACFLFSAVGCSVEELLLFALMLSEVR